MEQKVKDQSDGHKEKKLKGVVQSLGRASLPREFITIGEDFDAALGRCILRDDVQKNAVSIYKSQLEMFGLWEEIAQLTSWLNSSPAVGGINREQALEGHVGIYVPRDKKRYKDVVDLQKINVNKVKVDEKTEGDE